MDMENKKQKTARFWHDDWPDEKEDKIDLAVQDLPHKSSNVEWWYVNSHLKSDTGKELSLFGCFFRNFVKVNETTGEAEYGHALVWAICDTEKEDYHHFSFLEENVFDLDHEAFGDGMDRYILDPLIETLKRRSLPLPDRLLEGGVTVATDKLFIDYGGKTFSKDCNNHYHLNLNGTSSYGVNASCNLKLVPLKEPVRNRNNGVVEVTQFGDEMFYYFITRNECTGTVTIGDEKFNVTGNAWYDHEFGGDRRSSMEGVSKSHYNWNWLSIQFDDPENLMDLTACIIEDPEKPENANLVDSYGILMGKNGLREEYSNPTFEPVAGETWISPTTFVEYPTCWRFQQENVDLTINVAFPSQEFKTLLSVPAFWEGRINVTGTINGKDITGLGFIERHGYGREIVKDMKNMFAGGSRLLHSEIQRLAPLESDPKGEAIGDEGLKRLVGSDAYEVIRNFPNDEGRRFVIKELMEPLRDTYDRGGKAWRSLSFLIALEAVGGNAYKHPDTIAVPEVLHVGSLIIDDIQDNSVTRRGRPCCHLLYGVPTAINAACFSYFVAGLFDKFDNETRLRLYGAYFNTMLGGHAGQAADIGGLNHLMPEVVETGNYEILLGYIEGIHKLKTGLPIKLMVEQACIIARGNKVQSDAIGLVFETLGVAFQIMDDAVNLEGFSTTNWKTCGEDIMEGKVTYPIALAMKYLDKQDREKLWNMVKACPKDQESIAAVIKMVRDTGALQESRDLAHSRVSQAWATNGDYLIDSWSKITMKGIGHYLLELLQKSVPQNHSEVVQN